MGGIGGPGRAGPRGTEQTREASKPTQQRGGRQRGAHAKPTGRELRRAAQPTRIIISWRPSVRAAAGICLAIGLVAASVGIAAQTGVFSGAPDAPSISQQQETAANSYFLNSADKHLASLRAFAAGEGIDPVVIYDRAVEDRQDALAAFLGNRQRPFPQQNAADYGFALTRLDGLSPADGRLAQRSGYTFRILAAERDVANAIASDPVAATQLAQMNELYYQMLVSASAEAGIENAFGAASAFLEWRSEGKKGLPPEIGREQAEKIREILDGDRIRQIFYAGQSNVVQLGALLAARDVASATAGG